MRRIALITGDDHGWCSSFCVSVIAAIIRRRTKASPYWRAKQTRQWASHSALAASRAYIDDNSDGVPLLLSKPFVLS